MTNITIVGAGKLAFNLIPALQNAGYTVDQLISRSAERTERFRREFSIPSGANSLAGLHPGADVVFLSVNDGSIAQVARELPRYPGTLYLHSSGSVDIKALTPLGDRVGVLYPMQIFTESRPTADFTRLPLFVEANEAVRGDVERLGRSLSQNVQYLDSESRRILHLGAVLVCNFTNYLYQQAEQLVPGVGIRAYEALIREHVDRVMELGPGKTQTGPAIRRDLPTLGRHVQMLANRPELAELYRSLSERIAPGVWDRDERAGLSE